MMLKKIVLIFMIAFCSNVVLAQTLILSDKTQLKYDDPLLISHAVDTFIFKYKDWSFAHEVVNSKNIYLKVDLSGVERLYLSSIFDEKEREKLPRWLMALSEEQADSFGVKNNNVKRKKIGEADLIAVFGADQAIPHIYLFENLKIHHFVVHGNEKMLSDVINKIGVR